MKMDIFTLVYIAIPVVSLILMAIFYRAVFRLFGIVIIPEDKIGLVIKKFVLFGEKKALPQGRIIATQGEAGYQAQTLAPGIYFWYWFWQFDITMQSFIVVPNGKIGLLLARDGKELETGRVLARKVECDSFQNAEMFMINSGRKGRQTAVLTSGKTIPVTPLSSRTAESGSSQLRTRTSGATPQPRAAWAMWPMVSTENSECCRSMKMKS